MFVGGKLNGHVAKDNSGYEGCIEVTDVGDTIVDFAMSCDLMIANTCFKKRN